MNTPLKLKLYQLVIWLNAVPSTTIAAGLFLLATATNTGGVAIPGFGIALLYITGSFVLVNFVNEKYQIIIWSGMFIASLALYTFIFVNPVLTVFWIGIVLTVMFDIFWTRFPENIQKSAGGGLMLFWILFFIFVWVV